MPVGRGAVEFGDMLLGFGGKKLNDDNTPAFNSEEGVKALEKLVEIVDACMGAEGLTYSIDDSQIGIATGELAMAFTWASRAASMDDPDFSDYYVGGINFATRSQSDPKDGLYASTGGTGAGLGYPGEYRLTIPIWSSRLSWKRWIRKSQVRGSAVGVITPQRSRRTSRCALSDSCLRNHPRWRRRLGSTQLLAPF